MGIITAGEGLSLWSDQYLEFINDCKRAAGEDMLVGASVIASATDPSTYAEAIDLFAQSDADFVELDLLGTDAITITISYSTDDGVSYSTFATVTTPAALTAQLITNKFPKQVTARNVMFKVSGTGGQCKFGRFKLAFFDQSEF